VRHVLSAKVFVAKHLVEFVLQFWLDLLWWHPAIGMKGTQTGRHLLSCPPSGQGMLHFEFGQARLAKPHPLKAFELTQDT
jgi:hypothetical protein